ncbi:MAG TPA: tRNA (adenosine(37)-N6)-threonylcarbamoyltransferase complex transferase subunit TsaD [Phycisphaerales bacterium]|nr:tRNA (adenosine(37)-N6)-threonylcarbamoyltransferase complex transferase subunit TsaD [Phycisphaerales bacterium]
MIWQSGPILGIETSCDETAAAIVAPDSAGRPCVLSNIIATQHDLHARYAGVVPEIASRAHLEKITPIIRESLAAARMSYADLRAIAVGNRPGLIGSLLVGVSAAKSLACALGIPLVGVDHVAAHLHAPLLITQSSHSPKTDDSRIKDAVGDDEHAKFPALGLVVSGGHTSLFYLSDPLTMRLLGKTIDDAIGEAYDKVATILNLGYPGGPKLDQLAAEGGGDASAYALPSAPLSRETMDFSFSGLKTAVLYAVCGHPVGRGASARFERDASQLSDRERANVAASFQHAACAIIVRKMKRAMEFLEETDEMRPRMLLVGGGVSANSLLRLRLAEFAKDHEVELRLPVMEYCMDNAAMIAGYGLARLQAGEMDDLTLAASANTSLR